MCLNRQKLGPDKLFCFAPFRAIFIGLSENGLQNRQLSSMFGNSTDSSIAPIIAP